MGRTLPKILVTAGPTREYIDPTRFISNPSSGRMGYLIAKEARKKGCKVLLIMGPASFEATDVKVIHVGSALEMFREVRRHFRKYDVLVMAAAVSDYRPKVYRLDKIKKESRGKILELVPNPDILSWAAAHKGARFLIGFAAQTDHVLESAKVKLKQKKLDIMIANRVGRPGRGFESEKIEFSILRPGALHRPLQVSKKEKLARQIIHDILSLWE